MISLHFRLAPSKLAGLVGAAALAIGLSGAPAMAQVTAFKQAIAEAASVDDALGGFYRETGYAPLWTGEDDDHRIRRAALIAALEGVEAHGLPAGRYDVPGLMRKMRDANTTRDLGLVEVALSKALLNYARDVQSGILTPRNIDSGIVRDIAYRDGTQTLKAFQASAPRAFLASLAPANTEYRNLMKEKMRLEQVVANGTWGPTVSVASLQPGDTGPAVIALRNRLMTMGYMERSATRTYDTAMERAVQTFQTAHGLEADGVAGKGTVTEINTPAEDRLKSVIVAMERERWMNFDRGDRHIWVNLTDFTAKVIDHGEETFRTRSVIGKNTSDRRTPEFSDVMEHMIINPSWHVPRSIITKEYLPMLQRNPNAAGHMVLVDRQGRKVSRANTDFTQYSARNFPFSMSQPPSRSNALGLVKFMFPNKYNIYLHDTPSKNLFGHEVRAYSHGCIRLADPFDFAYALLAVQETDPEAKFQGILRTGRETKVDLVTHVPVHLIYRTAFTSARGKAEFRRDIYGRDARIWNALNQAGVALAGVQG